MMADLQYLLKNCSVQDNFFKNLTNKILDTSYDNGNGDNTPGFFTLAGISIALITDILLSVKFSKHGLSSLKKKLNKIFNVKTISRIITLTILVLFLPLVTVFLLLALLYKVLCSVIIIRKDKYFEGFLDSFDVFWSLEDDTTKNIINVLGVIESQSPYVIANNIKEKLENLFPNENTKKIFFRRSEEYGFYYWRRYNFIDMNQYVEVVEFPSKDELEVADLENLMTELQKQPLPYDDEGLFKILITKQRVGNYDQERGEYGIIFRIHHSVGDGVALIEFLCQTFADKTDDISVNLFSAPEQTSRANTPYGILDMMCKLCEIPVCFVDGILRKPDENSLHGPSLLGKKVFKWTESDENLLIMVKEIKQNADRLNFTDILLTALSTSLRNFYLETLAPVPEEVAVILPVRFPKTSNIRKDLVITNDFSVTILDLPVKREDNIKEIKRRCNVLRQSADPLTNYYFLKLITSILPKAILQPLLNSSQATMVFSNMPGPECLTICGDNALKSLVFFVPHKGTTGLGVTALCYGGVLRLAANADTAILPQAKDLAFIVDGMAAEIKRLHKLHVSK